MKYTEAKLEQAVIELLQQQGYTYQKGESIDRAPEEALLKDELKDFLTKRYATAGLTAAEADTIVRQLQTLPASDLYASNKEFMKWLSDGFTFKRERHEDKDVYIRLIDYDQPENNSFKIVNQLEIQGTELRIPDGILYVNGIPVVVFEFKSAIREEATLHDAYVQLTTRYRRDIPELLKYNAFCVISDGANNKAGSLFAPYEFFYAWRRTSARAKEAEGIGSLFTMVEGMFRRECLLDILNHFIYMPDTGQKEVKILCRYPQYYATRLLYQNILRHRKPRGDGKGGTYFGATGCGKSFTMLFLTRLLMKSRELASPTVILITDRTDLDHQLSKQFTNAKNYIGDEKVESVTGRADLRAKLRGRNSGGVFLTTIHKFNEDTDLLTDRTNVVCVSDEAHRSQTNLDQKITVTEQGVKKSFDFAKHLHASLPNATYVGFTGTPVDATLDVFGPVVDAYTMTESVKDEITVKLVYEGRAAKVTLNSQQLKQIEEYYDNCVQEGASEYHVEKSKTESAKMNVILGDPDRLETLAKDFVAHYENRITEGNTVKAKAMFVCSSRPVAYAFYRQVIALRPEWTEVLPCAEGETVDEHDKEKPLPMERIKMIMTRGKDDEKTLYDTLGNKTYRATLDKEFKKAKSNFRIAIVVDMWLTGFDVPFLDTIYIDKPLQKHNLIQTISRVNRKFEGKQKGLVVDYIGIKREMNLALAMYNKEEEQNFEDIRQSVIVVKNYLDLLRSFFHKFDTQPYFSGSPAEQLRCLNMASEFVLVTEESKKRFMDMVKRLKSAYDICSGSEDLSQAERDYVHFYLAIRTIVFKLTKGDAPDTEQMNARVREMVKDALLSDGVEEILKIEGNEDGEEELFSDEYLRMLGNIKLPNTKIQMLQKLLAKAIGKLKKVNKMQGVDFSKKMKALVDRYNERDGNLYTGAEFDHIANEMTELIMKVRAEFSAGDNLGIDFEEKAFYDILKALANRYDFDYAEDKLLHLAKEVKKIVDDKAKYADWNQREDIKAELKVDLIMLLAENDYPPVDRDEVYREIFEQAENFKKYAS
ncbi:DEAD/DEAH box helicase [Fulvitalea axinellae]|uniref:Type I restriction enzyme endonuclease subunit n=1 Tax=Fulvitalea axinellae TaxID=1182444 RepID=A0AAU9CQE8_9BACT|nr:DEAD/DEAH box helicase [Fulvitalea axinellae]